MNGYQSAEMGQQSRGDIVWLEFTPQTGREQAGHRPALVISPSKDPDVVGEDTDG
jgi:hypothetical protein